MEVLKLVQYSWSQQGVEGATRLGVFGSSLEVGISKYDDLNKDTISQSHVKSPQERQT